MDFLLAKIQMKWCLLCGRIGEWFLWQEWKPFTGRDEFNEAIKRLREEDNG